MDPKQKKIIIIGAGIAGLAAANQLKTYGYQVVLLEARDRCGGRIWTEDGLGLPLGRGASWIHGDKNNPILKLADRYQAQYKSFKLEKFLGYFHDGSEMPSSLFQSFNAKLEKLFKKAHDHALTQPQDSSIASALEYVMDKSALNEQEWDLFKFYLNFFECYVGGSYEYLSAQSWNKEEALPDDEQYVLTDSYRPIIQGLSRECEIVFHAVVKAISEKNNYVEIITDKEKYKADAVVVTLPLGVLKKNAVEFTPPLPNFKQKAIQHLGMGLMNISAFKFRKDFWPLDAQAYYFAVTNSPATSIFFNFKHFVGEPILFGNTGGETAKELESYSDEEVIEKTLSNFKHFFGGTPELEGYYITRWGQDPFSCGSYSYLQVGSKEEDYDAMALPISKRIFFAGEATYRDAPATTHGAYLSGVREAERIREME